MTGAVGGETTGVVGTGTDGFFLVLVGLSA